MAFVVMSYNLNLMNLKEIFTVLLIIIALKHLKIRYPNLKVVFSLGGWLDSIYIHEMMLTEDLS